MKTIIEQIRQTLNESIDEKTKNGSQRFFKEEIKSYGVKVPIVNQISKAYFTEIKRKNKTEIFDLCEELWHSGNFEECIIACNWSYALRKHYEREDFIIFSRWLQNYVSNWATCDTLCNHTIGTFIMMYPEYILELTNWAKSTNRWVKRAAAVTLIIPARKGLFLDNILELADILLLDKDDLVQKGYGWMLKAASESHQNEVFDYVVSKKAVMPRTALRYAIEKMPANLKTEAMKK
ncbi:DNA alkylation repair protein [Flavobacterium anhuiense]|uniref:DNA alkylation repair protein n=1 Tax=Flavobacterium anhuiense TaxID=459526 RepID=UPI003D987765